MLTKLLPALLLAFASAAAFAQNGMLFAVNEGVTYRTGGDAAKQNYKSIGDDIGKLLRSKVRVEVIGEYATLEKDLAAG
nr:phosphate ABC transporter substrate-binding protein [Burkholderiales bacterium]